MPDPSIATAADYADAMMTARRAKNLLVLLVLLCLLTQLGIFFMARYTKVIIPDAIATSQPTTNVADNNPGWADKLRYLVGFTDFVGVILTIVLSFVLLLIVTIMLVGRLIGVARTTSAYIWCLVLLVLLFPWQAFLSNATFTDPSFKIPGVLYTWEELIGSARFVSAFSAETILKWSRFVAFPVVAIILTLLIQVKSNRGLRQAFGEAEMTDAA